MSDAKHILEECLELLRELEVYEGYKRELLLKVDRAYSGYQKGRYGYLAYRGKLKPVLGGRTKEEWVRYYDAYEYSLVKRCEKLLSEAFYAVHKDFSYDALSVRASIRQPVFDLESELKGIKREIAQKVRQKSVLDEQIVRVQEQLAGKRSVSVAPVASVASVSHVPPVHPFPEDAAPVASAQFKKPRLFFLAVGFQRVWSFFWKVRLPRVRLPHVRLGRSSVAVADKAQVAQVAQAAVAKGKVRRGFLEGFSSLFSSRKRSIFLEEIVKMETLEKADTRERTESEAAVLGWISGIRVFKEAMKKEIVDRFRKKQEPVLGETTVIPIHMKKLRELRDKLYAEERLTGFETTLLVQEAKKVRKLISAERSEAYSGTSIGIIANVTVKRVSLFLVERFPGFFGFLYNALRAANIRMLSNTYVNVMILSTVTVSVLTFLVLLVVFFVLNYQLYQIVLRAFMFGLVAGVLCATVFYIYPFMRINERRRSITANLPFAINHMASVATSGVPPATMFELISGSTEYGEVAVELKKVSDFIRIFGYDLLTAVRAVASTTPSETFKEFLEGMVSTIETGGDFESFLRQKADEATLTYQLERQRYNQSISTYSDLYTGLLIAAPLFFVAALALVNLLGGKIGGLGVDVVIALGTYVAIPVLNIMFILFLQLNQPEA
ncbi:type II secretion system F family protein [Candidatus Woesearchaeota archaeon]|nr:type II secretion system F family protein [Candidatus Woesearchaeota archaeon]